MSYIKNNHRVYYEVDGQTHWVDFRAYGDLTQARIEDAATKAIVEQDPRLKGQTLHLKKIDPLP